MFQSTLPCGERPLSVKVITEDMSFNPRSRAGSDAPWDESGGGVMMFQSTLPCGERHHAWAEIVWMYKFQSTLPCGERLGPSSLMRLRPSRFQSTLPCGERRGDKRVPQSHPAVSIHAPVRGATPSCRSVLSGLSFNPRSRAGSDRLFERQVNGALTVSIHAPVRGATRPSITSA